MAMAPGLGFNLPILFMRPRSRSVVPSLEFKHSLQSRYRMCMETESGRRESVAAAPSGKDLCPRGMRKQKARISDAFSWADTGAGISSLFCVSLREISCTRTWSNGVRTSAPASREDLRPLDSG